MGRAPCCDKNNVKKGPWSPEEDAKLKAYIEQHGTGGNWIALPQKIGLKRCGKSCRLRWLNYLRPNLKHGGFSEEEDKIICSLYISIGSRWSIIAAQLPGRTDNDIKNYWNTKLKKKLFGKQLKEHGRSLRANHGLKQVETIMSPDNMNIHQNPSCPELSAVMQPVPYSNEEPHLKGHGSTRKLLTKFGEGSGDDDGRQAINGDVDLVYPMEHKSYECSIGLASAYPMDALLVRSSPLPSTDQYNMEDCFLDQMVYNVNPQKLDGLEFLFDNVFNNWKLGSTSSTGGDTDWSEIQSLVSPPPLASSYEGLQTGSVVQLPPFE